LAKFRTCASYRLAPDAVATVESNLLNLERVTDLSGLMHAITAIDEKARRALSA